MISFRTLVDASRRLSISDSIFVIRGPCHADAEQKTSTEHQETSRQCRANSCHKRTSSGARSEQLFEFSCEVNTSLRVVLVPSGSSCKVNRACAGEVEGIFQRSTGLPGRSSSVSTVLAVCELENRKACDFRHTIQNGIRSRNTERRESSVRRGFQDGHSSTATLHQIPWHVVSCLRCQLQRYPVAVRQFSCRLPCHRLARPTTMFSSF